jgi:hypothetical protein
MKECMEEAYVKQSFNFEVAAVVDPLVHFPCHLFGCKLIKNVHIVAVRQVGDFKVKKSFEETQVFELMVSKVIRT